MLRTLRAIWKSAFEKAAVGEVRRASTMQAFRFTPGFSLVGTFEFL
jgi:hypothetical protein